MVKSRLEELRGWAYEAPGASSWASLCAALEEEGEDGAVALEYLRAHLRRWPASLRPAPDAWARAPRGSWGWRCCRALAGTWRLGEEGAGVAVAAWAPAGLEAWAVLEGMGPGGGSAAWLEEAGGARRPLLEPAASPGDVTDYMGRGSWLALGLSEPEEGVGHVVVVDWRRGEVVAQGRLPSERLRERVIRASRLPGDEVEELLEELGEDLWLGALAEALEVGLGDFDELDETVSVAVGEAPGVAGGSWAAAACRLDGRVWRVGSRASSAVEGIGEHAGACGLVALPGGRLVSVGETAGGQPSLRLWDVARGSLLGETPVEATGLLAASPGGEHVACWGEEGVLLRVEARGLAPERALLGDRGSAASRGLIWSAERGPLGARLRGGRLEVVALEDGGLVLEDEARGLRGLGFEEGGRSVLGVGAGGVRVWRLG